MASDPAWVDVLAQVTEAARSALRDHPRIGRRSLIAWARALARESFEVPRLSPKAGAEIDRIVDAAIAASS